MRQPFLPRQQSLKPPIKFPKQSLHAVEFISLVHCTNPYLRRDSLLPGDSLVLNNIFELAASVIIGYMRACTSTSGLSGSELLVPVLYINNFGIISTTPKKLVSEYRTMHSSYHMIAVLLAKHRSLICLVASLTQFWQLVLETSPRQRKSPYNPFDDSLEKLLSIALEDKLSKREVRSDVKLGSDFSSDGFEQI